MIKKSRMIVAGALSVAVATAGIAMADGVSENDAGVVSKVTPSKLSKKKFSRVNVLLGVVNSPDSAGNEDANAKSERIAWSKNIKMNLSKAPKCNVDFDLGVPTSTARQACPPKSVIGTGRATVHGPGDSDTCDVTPGDDPPCLVATQTVTVFNGGPAGAGGLQLHTYRGVLDGGLGPFSPTVDARIVRANAAERRQGFGQALSVPEAPATGTIKITSFNAKISKASKVATAKCKPKKFKVKRTVVYNDNSRESVSKSQKCKVRR